MSIIALSIKTNKFMHLYTILYYTPIQVYFCNDSLIYYYNIKTGTSEFLVVHYDYDNNRSLISHSSHYKKMCVE